MKVILEIPDEEIKEQLKENTYVVEGEGEKGSVDIAMLYTNGTLDFICVEGREHFVRLKYKTLPDNATNGDVIKAMFPKGKVRREVSCTHDKTVFSFPDGTYFGAECRFSTDWWNEPYQGGQGNGNDN